ncbi:DinB family protein [Pseudomonas sp. NA-150]|uniref:DinB family protein n=1 Tax=Pseudomonas sp. NA-150 TaxID=3367525 RepID=UPI0037C629EF
MNYFLAQALNNLWANDRLLRACNALTDAEYRAPRTSFFPSIQSTLHHILDVDRYYLAALEQDLPGQDISIPADLVFADLNSRQRSMDRRLAALCQGLDQHELRRTVLLKRTAGPVEERIDRILLHLFEHQIHHRGQVHSMLSGTSVAAPQLDEFFMACDQQFREHEMRELGLTEDGLW